MSIGLKPEVIDNFIKFNNLNKSKFIIFLTYKKQLCPTKEQNQIMIQLDRVNTISEIMLSNYNK